MTFRQAPGARKAGVFGLLLIFPGLIHSLHWTDARFAATLPRCFWCLRPSVEALTQTLEVVHY